MLISVGLERLLVDCRCASVLDAHVLFRVVTLPGTRSVAGNKPPAMRVRIEGFALVKTKRPPVKDMMRVFRSYQLWKGGHFGK